MCVYFREISLISLHKDKTYTLTDFMNIQAEQCREASKRLVVLRERIIHVVKLNIHSCMLFSLWERKRECTQWTKMELPKSQKV